MAITDWTGNSGDWGDVTHWSNGVPNDSTAVADLGGTNKYTVSISNEAFTVGALNITDASATLDIRGRLTVNSSIINTGTITVDINGAQGSILQIVGDSTTGTSVEDGLGTIKVTGGALLAFQYVQTIDNATIMLGSGGTAFSAAVAFDGTGSPETFTLGRSVTIQTTGGASALHLNNNVYTLLNQGKILARKANDRLTIQGSFINSGTIAIANSDVVSVNGPNFSNIGTITVTGNGVFALSSPSAVMPTTYKTADLGTIRVGNGGSLDIDAVLDNTGAVLRVGDATSLHRVTVEGTIEGGTLLDTGNGFNFRAGTLNHVKYRGDLALNIPFVGESLTIDNGITLTGANGTGKGTLEIGAGYVGFRGTQTVNNATITLGTDVGPGNLAAVNATGIQGAPAVATLTLGSGLTLVTGGAEGSLGGTGRIVNRGTIVTATPGSTLKIDLPVFVNDARFTVDQGQTVVVGSVVPATIFNNNGAIEVTDGTLDVRGVAGGTGNYQIDGAGTLAFGKKTGDGLSILFYGTGGTLQVGAYNAFAAGYIGGFAEGDTIDLKNFAYSSTIKISFSNNALIVSAGKRTATLNLAGDYSATSFVAASDGLNGTAITYDPAPGSAAAHDSRLLQFASAIAAHSGGGAQFNAQHGSLEPASTHFLAVPAHH